MTTDQRTPATVCRTCGEPALSHDRFCEQCGTPTTPTPRTSTAHHAPSTKPTPTPALAPTPGLATAGERVVCRDCGGVGVGADGFCGRCGLRQSPKSGLGEVDLGPVGAAVSDRGLRRKRNEDAVAIAELPRGTCAVVCDGVATAPGSAEGARRAADAALAVLTGRVSVGMDPRAATRAGVERAAEVVAELARGPDASPACTFVSAIVDPAGVTVGWVGDSRAYWLSEAGSRLLTRDDSWAASMVEQGAMAAEDAWTDPRAHMITAWLGADAGPVEPHVAAFRPVVPGLVVLCSDGLWNDLPEADDLAAVALGGAGGPIGAARRLLRAALDAGGRDNVTAAVIPCPPPVGERSR
nr:protein phosphatase 2C domain-containing protein [Actinomadura bangladeshensis]